MVRKMRFHLVIGARLSDIIIVIGSALKLRGNESLGSPELGRAKLRQSFSFGAVKLSNYTS